MSGEDVVESGKRVWRTISKQRQFPRNEPTSPITHTPGIYRAMHLICDNFPHLVLVLGILASTDGLFIVEQCMPWIDGQTDGLGGYVCRCISRGIRRCRAKVLNYILFKLSSSTTTDDDDVFQSCHFLSFVFAFPLTSAMADGIVNVKSRQSPW